MSSKIDLHIHSTYSDGTFTPLKLIERAKEKGLSTIALTDHDTIAGIEECIQIGSENNLEVIPGIEISCDCGFEVHIVGLFIDYKSEKLSKKLEELIEQRNIRNKNMVTNFNKLGVKININEVEDMAGGNIIARPHFAKILVAKGYAKSIKEAFEVYLKEGKPGYLKRENRLTPKEAIGLINSTGGISILAHPVLLNKSYREIDELACEFKSFGLNGIEVYHSDHGKKESKKILEIAKKHNLLVSGGSDFHGDNKFSIDLGSGRDNLDLSYDLLQKMKDYLKK